MKLKAYILIVLFVCPLWVYAAQAVQVSQRLQVRDGDQVKVIISRQDVSRLAVEGEGRLKKVWSPQGYLDLQADKAQGEAFFKAARSAPASFSFFARDDFGNTFTILATQKNVPSQTIILIPQNRIRSGYQGGKEKALPYKKSVNKLFKAMFLDKNIYGYSISDLDEIVPVWSETEIKLIKHYRNSKFLGEVYWIKNISDSKLKFHESEFFDFGENVLAAGLEKLSLAANQSTKLYVVRGHDRGNK